MANIETIFIPYDNLAPFLAAAQSDVRAGSDNGHSQLRAAEIASSVLGVDPERTRLLRDTALWYAGNDILTTTDWGEQLGPDYANNMDTSAKPRPREKIKRLLGRII